MGMGGLECVIMGGVIVVGLLVVNYIAVTLQERREAAEGIVKREPGIDWDAANDPEVREHLSKRQKINAIKRYRELTGTGLKEAKDAIDFLEANPDAVGDKKKKPAYDTEDAGIRDLIRQGKVDEAVEIYARFAGVDEYTARDEVERIKREMSEGEGIQLTDDSAIRELVREGRKLEAIKQYRQQTGVGLLEAMTAVDAIERQVKGW